MKVSEYKFTEEQKQHFWSKVSKKSDNECWEWLGSFSNRSCKYDLYWEIDRRYIAVSPLRVSYFLYFGAIDEAVILSRNCSNAKCMNPNHMTQKGTRKVPPGPKPQPKEKCLNCGVNDVQRGSRGCCSDECGVELKYKENLRKWFSGEETGGNIYGVSGFVRHYLFKLHDNKCSLCGWCEVNPYTKKIPLQVEHIDGNWENNRPDNLTLICPNCHSLTATFGGRNKGKGRYSVFKAMGKTPYGPGSGS